jgi:hypothetical protein
MSRTKFIKESQDYSEWRIQNNLPVHRDIFNVDKFIRDKWIAENRHAELLSYILDEWDNGDFNEHTDFIEGYESYLLQNERSQEFINLWKGILSLRLESLWWYKKQSELDDKNSTYLSETIERQKFVIKGIERFIEGLKQLNLINEIDKMNVIKSNVLLLKRPKPKSSTDSRNIDEKLFWQLIDDSRKNSTGKSEFISNLKNQLEALKPKEIRNFDKLVTLKSNELHTFRNWALAYTFRQGSSEDEFDYFKAWVVSMGWNAFEIIKQFKLNKISDLLFFEDPQFEKFMYLAEEVYEEKTFQLMKPNKIKQKKITGKEWNEQNIQKIYPEILELYNQKNNRFQ